tara:strand:- start:7639 stop:8562 length:924 start_codon:yes stop_codon:yes gene_type:complete
MKVKEVVDEWVEWLYFTGCEHSSVETYERMLLPFFRNEGLMGEDIKKLDIKIMDGLINGQGKTGVATRKMKYFIMKSFFKFCQGKGYRQDNPALLLKVRMKDLTHAQKERKVKVPYSSDEFKTLTIGFTDFLYDAKGFAKIQRKPRVRFWRNASIIAYWTGLRFGDICNLERDCFSSPLFNEGDEVPPTTLTVWTDKRDKRVELPLDPDHMGGGVVAKILSDLNVTHPDGDYFFPKERGLYNDLSTKANLFKDFKRWNVRFGIQDRTFHCLRHAFVTRLDEGGVDMQNIAELVGHSSTSTTEAYSHR